MRLHRDADSVSDAAQRAAEYGRRRLVQHLQQHLEHEVRGLVASFDGVLLSLARVALRCHCNLMAMPLARCSYVLWYPFAAEDAGMKARFSLRFEG